MSESRTQRQIDRDSLMVLAEERWQTDPDFDPRTIDPEWKPPNTTHAAWQDLGDVADAAGTALAEGAARLVGPFADAFARRTR